MEREESYGAEAIVAEDAAAPDEMEAIREARRDIANGDLYTQEEVWA